MNKKTLLILILSVLGVGSIAFAQIPVEERDALIDIYNSTNGADWNQQLNWLGPPGSEDTWYGVVVENDGVESINLDANNLKGMIPSSIGRLSHLKQLSLMFNQLTGSLPSEIGDLQNLEVLRLGYNYFTDEIPGELGQLTNLTMLYLANNDFSGAIPIALGQLENLIQLNLFNNHFSGKIPGEIGNLANLKYLSLDNNRLTGPVPSTITQLTQLVEGQSDFRYNALYTDDGTVADFLTLHQAGVDWQSTQTVAPQNFSVQEVGGAFVTLTWTPILYKSGTGGYEIYHSQSLPGPFTLIAMTEDKYQGTITIENLKKETTYYFRSRTVSDHVEAANVVFSDYSSIVSATTTNENSPPVCRAGLDQSVKQGDLVFLDGSQSIDPEGGMLSYLWTQTAGIPVSLSDPAAVQPVFRAPSGESSGYSIVFELRVTDTAGLSSTDSCTVRVYSSHPPQADAGRDQNVLMNETVTLDGSGSSDADDGIETYEWVQIDGIPVSLSSDVAISPYFTAPVVGESGARLVFELTVTDAAGLTDSDTVTIMAFQSFVLLADAGADQTVAKGETVILDASESTIPGAGVQYLWTQILGPGVTLSNPTGMTTSFIAPTFVGSKEVLRFKLTIQDNEGNVDEAVCTVNVVEAFNMPQPPIILYPENESSIQGGSVSLRSSYFFDVDGDNHYQTHWKVRRIDRNYDDPDYPESFRPDPSATELTEHLISDLQEGLKYACKVGYEDDSGSGLISWSKESFFKVGNPTQTPMMAMNAGTDVQDLVMVSFPVWPEDPNAIEVFGGAIQSRYGKDFRIGAYDPTYGEGGYHEYGGDLYIAPGRAIWFFAEEDFNIQFNGIVVSPSQAVDVNLLYNFRNDNGWNMVACPNEANYAWNDVQVLAYDADQTILFGPTSIGDLEDTNTYLDPHLWRWETGNYHSDTEIMEKNKGYWVRARRDRVALRFLPTAQRSISALYIEDKVPNKPQLLGMAEETPPMPISIDINDSSSKKDSAGSCFIEVLSNNDR